MKTTKNIFFYFLIFTTGIIFSCTKADISEPYMGNEINAPNPTRQLTQCEGTEGECGEGGWKYKCGLIGTDCWVRHPCKCPDSKIYEGNINPDLIEEKGIPVTEEMIRENYSDFLIMHENWGVRHPEDLIKSRK